MEAGSNTVLLLGGVSLGSHSSECSSALASNPNGVCLQTNDISARSTPSIVSFGGKIRTYGTHAESQLISQAERTAALLPQLLSVRTKEDLCKLKARFGPVVTDFGLRPNGKDDGPDVLSVSQILSPYLRQMALFAVDGQNQKLDPHLTVTESLSASAFVFALPDAVYADQTQAVLCVSRSLKTGVVCTDFAAVTSQSFANVCAYVHEKMPSKETLPLTLAIVNCSYTETTFALFTIAALDAVAATDSKDANTKNEKDVNVNADDALNDPNATTDNNHQPSSGATFPFLGRYLVSIHEVAVESNLGVADLNRELAFHVEKELSRREGVEPVLAEFFTSSASPSTTTDVKKRRAAFRVLSAVEKSVCDLSGLSVCSLNFSNEKVDCSVELTRELFEKLNETAFFTPLDNFLTNCAQRASTVMSTLTRANCKISAIELVGGGCRIPRVQTAVQNAFPNSDLRRTLDGTSVSSYGACVLANPSVLDTIETVKVKLTVAETNTDSQQQVEDGTVGVCVRLKHLTAPVWEDSTEKELHMTTERMFRDLENAEIERLNSMDLVEREIHLQKSILLQLKNGQDDSESAKIELEKFIIQFEDEFRFKMENSTTEEYLTALRSLQNESKKLLPNYHAKEAEKIALEAAAAASASVMEQLATPFTDDIGDDHDDRKWPNSKRLEKARKQKDEANENFKSNIHSLAIKHYLKAAQHLDKIHNPTDQELIEKNQLATAIYLNIAQVYLKQQTQTNNEQDQRMSIKTIEYCDKVLAIDINNSKANYRKALALERMNKPEEAKKALASCANDPAVQQALERLTNKIKQDQTKQKKFFSRMFG